MIDRKSSNEDSKTNKSIDTPISLDKISLN